MTVHDRRLPALLRQSKMRAQRGLSGSALPLLAFALCACTEDETVIFRVGSGQAAQGGNGSSTGLLTEAVDSGSPAVGGASPASGGRATGGIGPVGTGGRALGAGGALVGSGGSTASGGAPGTGGTGGGSSGGGPFDAGPGTHCATESDCPSGWTCSKPSCAASTGACEPRPILCDLTAAPVCGCDHVTYWNDCLRKQNGVTAASFGQCGIGALPCMSPLDCGVPGAFCSHILAGSLPCGPAGPGTCWVTPIDCTSVPSTALWMSCQTPPFGTRSPCVDTCTAIRSGEVYVPVPLGMSCP